jgi:hypothetical protein
VEKQGIATFQNGREIGREVVEGGRAIIVTVTAPAPALLHAEASQAACVVSEAGHPLAAARGPPRPVPAALHAQRVVQHRQLSLADAPSQCAKGHAGALVGPWWELVEQAMTGGKTRVG